MGQIWKQFAAWATASEHKVFFWARLKLTGVYVLIVAVIVIGFSLYLYQSLAQNLGDTVEGDFASSESQQHFFEHALASFENDLLLVDIIIVICTGALGYALAGYTLRPIQRALEAQQAFSEKASHELRTPLAVMRNDMEVLLRNPSPTKELMQAALRSNIEEIDHLTAMTKDLLTLARSQNGITAASEKIDLADMARGVVEKMRPLFRKKGITIRVAAEKPAVVIGRTGELARVLTNLLQNAIGHTPSGGSIAVEVRAEDSYALMRVSDTGVGIDPKDLPHVFERFYKGEGTEGSGLGLSIVKELIARHGGEISIESEKGKGTRATIRLPRSA